MYREGFMVMLSNFKIEQVLDCNSSLLSLASIFLNGRYLYIFAHIVEKIHVMFSDCLVRKLKEHRKNMKTKIHLFFYFFNFFTVSCIPNWWRRYWIFVFDRRSLFFFEFGNRSVRHFCNKDFQFSFISHVKFSIKCKMKENLLGNLNLLQFCG